MSQQAHRPSSSVDALRQLLAERFPGTVERPKADLLSTGLRSIDSFLDGGLERGSLSEFVAAAPSCGSQLLLLFLLQAARTGRHCAALVDGRDSFDPQTAPAELLPHLLWVRCRQATEALAAADLLLRDGNAALVLLDLRMNPELELRRIPATTWYRLQRAAEQSGAAGAVFTPRPMVSSSRIRLVLPQRYHLDGCDLPAAQLASRLEPQLHRRRYQAGGKEAIA